MKINENFINNNILLNCHEIDLDFVKIFYVKKYNLIVFFYVYRINLNMILLCDIARRLCFDEKQWRTWSFVAAAFRAGRA